MTGQRGSAWRLCTAPMMDWSDRHCRYLFRLVSPRARVYTEMVVANAVLRGDRARLLDHDPAEHPVALQLGGSDPTLLAQAARLGEQWGYDEINLNVGCPSDRVQNATFGACLMAQPARVADCVAALRAAVHVPVTVKCRIGIDDRDDWGFLETFVAAVVGAGCEALIVHARKAILQGLSPKQNRAIPPLVYPTVWRVKRDFPALTVVANGGIKDVAAAPEQWAHVDGVMLGRQAYHDPGCLAALEAAAWPEDPTPPFAPAQVVDRLEPYVRAQLAAGQRLHAVTRHALGLYAGRPGARAWRRVLSELANRPGAGFEVLEQAREAAERGGAAPRRGASPAAPETGAPRAGARPSTTANEVHLAPQGLMTTRVY